jgi:hypothetical protein
VTHDVHFRFEAGIDRRQVVGAVDGDAVAGIEKRSNWFPALRGRKAVAAAPMC